ncbi:MAG: histidine kinase dimerization/phospho-acceptor domain-containing protein [Steroidobacteraceae bacterium]
MPLTTLLVHWILSRGFRPLGALTDAVTERSPEDLRAVPAAGAPAEVAPLLAALNRLLARMRAALQLGRRFTADAAHELRSPLAAIRANAQVMQRARSPGELAGAAGDLLASVDRSSHLIDQLLLLAASTPEQRGTRVRHARRAPHWWPPPAPSSRATWRSAASRCGRRSTRRRCAARRRCSASCCAACSTTPSATRRPTAP